MCEKGQIFALLGPILVKFLGQIGWKDRQMLALDSQIKIGCTVILFSIILYLLAQTISFSVVCSLNIF